MKPLPGAPPRMDTDSGEEDNLMGFDDVDILDSHAGPSDRRESAQQKLVDADFFNAFPDDFDESDMQPSS